METASNQTASELAAAKAAEKDPPYLAQLLKDHPGLTREKALEMIEAFGG